MTCSMTRDRPDRLMATVQEYQDSLIETGVLSDHETDGWIAEVWDLTPATGGHLLNVHKHPSGTLTVDLLGNRLEAGFLAWALEIAKTELQDYG